MVPRLWRRAALALGLDANNEVPCPICGEGVLNARQQRVGRRRFVHLTCDVDPNHYVCIDAPREELFRLSPAYETETAA